MAGLQASWATLGYNLFSLAEPGMGAVVELGEGADTARRRLDRARGYFPSGWSARTDTTTTPGAFCGTDGSNPIPSCGESSANLTASIRAPKSLLRGLRVASLTEKRAICLALRRWLSRTRYEFFPTCDLDHIVRPA